MTIQKIGGLNWTKVGLKWAAQNAAKASVAGFELD